MGDGNKVGEMTPVEKLAYVHAYLEDMIAENAIADPQLSAGLKVLKEQLDKPGVDKAKAVEALAKNLPDISKGIIAAREAFLKGDGVTGAAEIMNICAAVAPIIGAFSATGGPAGMLAGAIFSVIGQIIALFQPAKESDVDKIKAFLLAIEADAIERDAEANLTSIRNAAKGTREQADETKKALKSFNEKVATTAELLNHDEFLNFSGALKQEIIDIAEFKLIDGPTVLQHWGVASWLQDPSRQDQDEWPEILGIFCQAWADLLTAYITIISFANSVDMQSAFSYVAPSNASKWSYLGGDDDRKEVEKDLQWLNVYASKRLRDIRNCNKTMSAILEKLKPVARKRGLFVVRGSWDIVSSTGAKAFRETSWGQSFWASCSRFLITAPNEGLTTPRAQYHLWVLDTRGWKVGHARIDSQKRTQVAGTNSYIGSAAGFSDICALPSPKDKNGSFVYCAHEQGSEGYVELFERGADGDLSKGGWSPGSKAPIFQVRAVTPPRSTLDNDPDKDAMPRILKLGTNHYNSIIYGALRSSPEIYVNPANESCHITSPWGVYAGIAVDPYYLWVWGTGGFACTTHASVMRCIADQKNGKKSTPRWLMGPSIHHLLYDGEQYFDATQVKAWPATKGLVDFCPCEDGTLFISLTTRKVNKEEIPYVGNDYTRMDSNAIYAAAYHIDLEKQTLTVEPYEKDSKDAWMKLPGGEDVQQVQKLPIYCWPLFTRLKDACASPEWTKK